MLLHMLVNFLLNYMLPNANWLTAISSILLTLITGVYAYLTYQMVSYSKLAIKNTSLEAAKDRRPYLAFYDFRIHRYIEQNGDELFRITVRLKNTGASMLKYSLINRKIITSIGIGENTYFKNRGSYVYPDLIEEFRLGSVRISGLDVNAHNAFEMTVSYEIEYSSMDHLTYKTERQFSLTYYLKTGNYEWFYLDSNDS